MGEGYFFEEDWLWNIFYDHMMKEVTDEVLVTMLVGN
jgi:hypothetical protein